MHSSVRNLDFCSVEKHCEGQMILRDKLKNTEQKSFQMCVLCPNDQIYKKIYNKYLETHIYII